MTISLSDAGKRFNREWIFRHFNYQFETGEAYAIIGPNGSGKSTLLQVLSGSMMPNEGTIQYKTNGQLLDSEKIYRQVAICAPYLDLVEEMTLTEFLEFHTGFKPLQPGLSTAGIIEIIGLQKAAAKQIRYYSSGMKQRVKLAQSVFADAAILLLDEPCTNLDQEGVDLYNRLIRDYCAKKMVIVSSNDHHEYDFCTHKLQITDWK